MDLRTEKKGRQGREGGREEEKRGEEGRVCEGETKNCECAIMQPNLARPFQSASPFERRASVPNSIRAD